MKNLLIFFLGLLVLCNGVRGAPSAGGVHVCTKSVSYKKKYQTNCKLFGWSSCTKYRTAYRTSYYCCSGWRQYYSNGCPYAVCDDKINPTGACSISYYPEYIKYRNQNRQFRSGGSCTSPETCTSCNDGFYSDGNKCRICPQIAHCWHRKCTSPNDNICEYCDGDVLPKVYHRAYTSAYDNKKSCREACSWRTNTATSTRCYPGRCNQEIVESCVCVKGFKGRHCDEMTEYANILYNEAKLQDVTGSVLANPTNPNHVLSNPPTIWTNNRLWSEAYTKWSAKYVISEQPPAYDSSGTNHFVTDFKYGIIYGLTKLTYTSGSSKVDSYNCPGVSQNIPMTVNFHCENTFKLSKFTSSFSHNNKLTFTILANLGGYVSVMNRENYNRIDKYYLKGTQIQYQYVYHWDLVNPVHCVETGTSPCPWPVSVPDLTENPTITATWGGWSDALSQLHKYQYELYRLGHNGVLLSETQGQKVLGPVDISLADSSLTLTIPSETPGTYALHFSAFDTAGNWRTARNVFLFDDESVVDKVAGKVTRVMTASADTNYLWVARDTGTVTVMWTDRFVNSRHKEYRWLNTVDSLKYVDSAYDDNIPGSTRTISAIDNVHGVVKFEVSYSVNDGIVEKDTRTLTSVSDFHGQQDIINIIWSDGDKLNATVRATDILGKYNEESVVVYRDASKPIIDELWLTRGNRLNISVHSIEDFTKMTIEWVAYDLHSGLNRVSWRLYDNYNQDDVVEHGHENIIAQGDASNLEECNTNYISYPRGANCYCTPFWGCYHKHFQVKPAVKLSGGLHLGKDQGVHDADYFIEVKVTNNAELTTILTKQITIDTSPPHTGIVHDGIKGNPELDYQQELIVKAYWDGFFDRESGVLFYQYGFHTDCIPAASFGLDNGNQMITETYSLHATYTAPGEGRYYVTVVAYNRALEPSEPVCSDGVTIDTRASSVKEVVIDGARITGGLITDSTKTKFWVVGSNRVRRVISNPNAECTSKAQVISDLDILPIEKYANKTEIEVDGDIFCSNTSGAPAILSPVLTKSSLLHIEWLHEETSANVHDYEVGFSQTPGSAAPDILSFRSTKQNPHIRIMHADIPDGTMFYIIIKSISKSSVEQIQTIGPCYVDTTRPDFTGSISVTYSAGYLVASWPAGAFSDPQEPYQLDLEFTIGHNPGSTEVNKYQSLLGGGTCVLTTSPTCTAIKVSDTEWQLHGHHTYYVTIKAENSAGLVTYASSGPYIHDVQLASKGIVLDTSTTNLGSDLPLKDIEDIDFTTTLSSLSARWSGFSHPHLDVTYKFSIGTTPGGNDVVDKTDIGQNASHTEVGLNLTPFQTYYVTITAVTSVGSVHVTSDGVTIVEQDAVLSGIFIYDGEACNMTEDNGTLFTHQDEDNRVRCRVDIDYQSSTSNLKAYWTVPSDMKLYTPDVHFSVEERSSFGNTWTVFRDYEHISTHNEASATDLALNPGKVYRISVKLCAVETCYKPFKSDGVLILSNPPTTGSITVRHLNTSQSGGPKEKITITMDRFYDPDVQSDAEKYEAIEKYEWAITDQSDISRTHTIWTTVNPTIGSPTTTMSFEIDLDGIFDFSKCRRFALRGYNKAKLVSYVSADVRNCAESKTEKLIIPNIVIDAVGKAETDRDQYGQTIYLEENKFWLETDKDYTPYKNFISAVWPTLRYSKYTVAVLKDNRLNPKSYYEPDQQLDVNNICSHVDTVKCQQTTEEYINVKFDPDFLKDGQRYVVCVYAKSEVVKKEKWDNHLPELTTCSDGIMVDLHPPVAGNVWIGTTSDIKYQTSTTDMYVNWESFKDVEENYRIGHSSGIQDYRLGLGTSIGGNDMVAFYSVGVVNHAALHNLRLQNGHTYYATIEATDYANRKTLKTSLPVIVDSTPPVKTDKAITMTSRHIVSKSEIEVCWEEVFEDPESSIEYYMWSVGSLQGYDDIMTYTRVDATCAETDKSSPLDLHEGHAYFFSVKAFNGAGLMTMATSWAYVVDVSPPVAGHVYDGPKTVTGNHKDIDFQTDMSALHAFWDGFYDPHTPIKEYYISIGTCPSCGDVIENQAIGIINEYKVDRVHFGAGLTYYTTVTACNTADLCTSVTTDGLVMDNSPPSMGIVNDGTTAIDIEYQAIRTSVGAKWYGFTDPQSGLLKYVWSIGTTKGGYDVMSETEVHLTDVASVHSLSSPLPVGVRIYSTIKAYNKAGLVAMATSNGFLIDETPPVISSGPTFFVEQGIPEHTQFFRSWIKIKWDVSDSESYIERQFLSVKGQQGGEFDFASTEVSGLARDFILTGLKLHDGVEYNVNLICCNGAKICTTAVSSSTLVDSTPPSRGMFAIKTDHTANLTRHLGDWMGWTTETVNVAWLGFADLHSGIEYYYVNIGSTYMGDDLNKPSLTTGETSQRFSHADNGLDMYDEGKVQQVTVDTINLDVTLKSLYISVWAVNKVGLSSTIIHSKFEKIPGGTLELVRRCSNETCIGHCVCAAQDKLCHVSGDTCKDVSDSNPNNILSISDNQYGTYGKGFTSTNTLLRASWSIDFRKGEAPKWYQWSVGLTSETRPVGIFDEVQERVWHDAGQWMEVIFTTKPGTTFSEDVQYSFFLRVWYDSNTYAVFKSIGVVIASAPPTPTNIRGSSVTETMEGSKMKDEDFIKYRVPFIVDWKNKFISASETINHFSVYISTYPGGHDILDSGIVEGSASFVRISKSSLIPGVKYYSNVIAYSYSGLHHTESSDGFRVDRDKPVAGVVYDGIGLHDLEYQNTSKTVGARWHGFTDVGSGVMKYYWCVGKTNSPGECQIRRWESVGLHTSVSRTLSNDLTHGEIYYNKVYAKDVIGKTSSVVVSDGFIIDTTPPVPQKFIHLETNIAQNPSFEISGGRELTISVVNSTELCSLSVDYHPENWSLSPTGCAAVVSSDKNLARDGRSFAIVRGSFTQTINNLLEGELYRLQFYSSHLSISSSVLANKEGFAELGNRRHIFMLYTKAYRSDDHGSIDREVVSWHKHTFYFMANSVSTSLTIGSVDMTTGVFFDDLSLQHVQKVNQNDIAHVNAHVVYLHEWGSIHGSWYFLEDQSPIVDYKWAIGYTEGGTQIQEFRSVGLGNSAYNSNVQLVHNTYVYITVIATNAVGLLNVAYSDRILVDLTPPVIEVFDGKLLGQDQESWELNEISVSWMANDYESGLEYCEWAIGYQPQGIELQEFKRISLESVTPSPVDFPYSALLGRTIYSTIKCQSKAGLLSSNSTNGQRISNQKPSANDTVVRVMPQSITEYPAQEEYQSEKDNIQVIWSGFADYIGVAQYKLKLEDDKSELAEVKMPFPEQQDTMYVKIMNLGLSEGLKTFTIQAINKQVRYSEMVKSNVTVYYSKPTKQSAKFLSLSWDATKKELTSSWVGVFQSDHSMHYEVSCGQYIGGGNILQWQETKDTTLTFGFPPSVIDLSNIIVYVTVQAITAGGVSEAITGYIRLPVL